jgi:hypothetical protein
LCQIRGDINAASNCYEKIIAAKWAVVLW